MEIVYRFADLLFTSVPRKKDEGLTPWGTWYSKKTTILGLTLEKKWKDGDEVAQLVVINRNGNVLHNSKSSSSV